MKIKGQIYGLRAESGLVLVGIMSGQMPGSFVPNSKQRQAIEHVHGPLLALAGAGTGKTTVLVERIAYLIENQHAQPEEILAITFTENAAKEMKERVSK